MLKTASPRLRTIALSAAALAVLGLATTVDAHQRRTRHTHAVPMGVKVMATLNGASEVPGPGDGDGMGHFMATITPGTGRLCYTLTSSMIGTRTMAHIHTGAAGVAGPPVVTLMANAPTQTCMTIARALAQSIVNKPGDFYVNIHTADFPKGAVRGQTMKHGDMMHDGMKMR